MIRHKERLLTAHGFLYGLEMKEIGRERYLDGLRGVAALIVMVEHASRMFHIDEPKGEYPLGLQMLETLIQFPVTAGIFCVYIFFIISGIVIANSANGYKPWPKTLGSRYLRLTIPMIVSTILAYILLQFFPGRMNMMAVVNPNHWTTTTYQNGSYSILTALLEPIYGIYIPNIKPYFNPVLWSMKIEMYGSFAIFTCYQFLPDKWRCITAFIVLMMLTSFGFWQYAAFPLGVLLYEKKLQGSLSREWIKGWMLISTGLLCGIIGGLPAMRYYDSKLSPVVHFPSDLKVAFYTAGAFFLVSGIIRSARSRALLTNKAPMFLGRISYALYLVHMPLLYTVFAAIFLRIVGDSLLLSIIWAASFCASAIAIAWFFTILIDEPVTRRVRIRKQPAPI